VRTAAVGATLGTAPTAPVPELVVGLLAGGGCGCGCGCGGGFGGGGANGVCGVWGEGE